MFVGFDEHPDDVALRERVDVAQRDSAASRANSVDDDFDSAVDFGSRGGVAGWP